MLCDSFIRGVLFPWFGMDLIIAAIMLLLLSAGIMVSDRINRMFAIFSITPIAIFIVLFGLTLIRDFV